MGTTTTTTAEARPSFGARHKASALVLASQVTAAFVHGVVKALESGAKPVGPLQILLIRMLITGVACSLYLWIRKNPEFPLGRRDVRPLVLLRAVGGVLGAGGMYYSISYLTLSSATALNFLAPMGAMILSKYTDRGNVSITDRVGAAIALAGVVMVVQPDAIFQRTDGLPLGPRPDSYDKVKGLACGAVGVLGTSIALTTMRRIGSKAHPLLVVNYFAWVVVLVAGAALVVEQPAWPHTVKAWAFMTVIGVFACLMEFLLTAGISGDPSSSAATLMVYSQVLWALALDRVVWRVRTNGWTLAGAGGVVASLVLVALAQEMRPPVPRRKQRAPDDEARPVAAGFPLGVTTHAIDLDDMYDGEEANPSW